MTGTGGLSEDDISVKFITPALHKGGWDEATQIRRQVPPTKGLIIVRGRLVARGKSKRADFVLYYRHIPMVLIEAEKATFSGMLSYNSPSTTSRPSMLRPISQTQATVTSFMTRPDRAQA